MDPITISALIAGGATIGSGLINAFTQKVGADQNAQAQRETNAMTMELANTAHQREVKDLKAAGLNPLLSGTGGKGADTPTLRAPEPGAGTQAAGQAFTNAMNAATKTVLEYATGQQQIDYMRAQADAAKANAEYHRELANWVAPQASQSLQESQSRIVENTAKTELAMAQTATNEAMREPEVARIVAQTANTVQTTKSEEQRTRELTAMADQARRIWGARAQEAVTIAAQAVDYYKNYYATEHTQKIDKTDLEIELLRNENFRKVIDNILENQYGHQLNWAKIFSSLPSAGAAIGAPKGQVTDLPQNYAPKRSYQNREWQ